MRTRPIPGGVVFGLLVPVTWLGIALLSWLWGQFPLLTETGKRLSNR